MAVWQEKIERLSLEHMVAYITEEPVARRICMIIMHHFWSPNAAQYRGAPTWNSVNAYHRDVRGWSRDKKVSIGYQIGVGPDRSLWKLRPLGRSGAHTLGHNSDSVGVALAGNCDEDDPMLFMPAAAQVVGLVLRRFKLGIAAIRFHREFADKTCPGTRMSLAGFRANVAESMGKPYASEGMLDTIVGQPHYAVVLGGNVVPCIPRIEVDDRLTIKASALLPMMGVEVSEVPAGVIHGNGRCYALELFDAIPHWSLEYRMTPMGHRWYPQDDRWPS